MITHTPLAPPATTRTTPLLAQMFGEPRFHADADVAALAFAPDGTLLSVDDAGVLRLWSEDGRVLRRQYLSDLETLWAFSPDGKLLASGKDDLLFWNVADGQLLGRDAAPSWITALAFSPDGRTLASGHDDGRVRFWDAATRQPLGEVIAHSQPVSALAYAPAGDRFASAGEDRLVRVWDAMSHAKLNELASHTDRVPSLAWKPDGTLLVSAGWDRSARVWAPAHADPLMLLNSHSEQVLTLAWSPDGQVLAAADSDNHIYLWSDPVGPKVQSVLRGHIDEIRAMAFRADGKRLASAGADRVIHVWDVAAGKLVAGPNPEGRNQVAVVKGAENRTLLASTGSSVFRLWDTFTGEEVWPSGDGPAHCVAADPNGKWLAVGGTDHITRLYDLTRPKSQPRKLEATKPPVGALAFSSDGALMAQASPTDGLVWLWTPTGEEASLILIEAADGCTLESLAFLPDSNRVAVGGIDVLSTGERSGAVCVWNLATQQKDVVFDCGVDDLAIDPKGRYIAGAGLNDTVFVWDIEREETVFELAGHTDRVNGVAFSPDGSYLAGAGDDHTVRLWDVLSGRLLVAREFDAAVQSLVFSPDGNSLFLGHANTTCTRVLLKKFLED